MIRIVVWDIDKIGIDWFDRNTNTDMIEIVDMVSTEEGTDGIPIEILMEYADEWDYLFIFTRKVASMASEIVNKLGIPDERVVFPLDAYSLCDHSEMARKVFRNNVERRIAWATQKRLNDYVTCTVDGLSYIAPSYDNGIIANMYINNSNWAKEDMERFYDLSHQFYDLNDEQTYFCDIGANIGTTCIYFKKKLDPGVKILALEPVDSNFRLLKINMNLNDIAVEDELVLPYAVGEHDDRSQIYIHATNSGGNSIVSQKSDKTQDIIIRSFDSLMTERGISAGELKYLWVDVEGYELNFLKGARNTIREMNAPIVMEFLPEVVGANEGLERYVETLKEFFTGFIVMQDAGNKRHEITELSSFSNEEPMDLFLLK
ncbi:methyltransferase, FkbM family [Lachnospiraceae bacterium XBB2008]|nr:methyltransferase, FkbM family [Lachnospiraceae bacterium XBB2008]